MLTLLFEQPGKFTDMYHAVLVGVAATSLTMTLQLITEVKSNKKDAHVTFRTAWQIHRYMPCCA